MNFKHIFRWHYLVLFILLCSAGIKTANANILLIVGDSLSAGYRISADKTWPTLLAARYQEEKSITLINASISGDTSAQGLARFSALLKKHKPKWVLIELGGNDGLQGIPVANIEKNLIQLIEQAQAAKVEPLLMQIRIPPNYGTRYSTAFHNIYPNIAQQYQISLLPFFMEKIALLPEWMQADGIHPNEAAQPEIANLMKTILEPYINKLVPH